MTAAASRGSTDVLELDTDVLVIGGGPAAVWAALTARAEGARVLLVDKGFCGSSGVAAAATAGHWWVPPDKREEALSRARRARPEPQRALLDGAGARGDLATLAGGRQHASVIPEARSSGCAARARRRDARARGRSTCARCAAASHTAACASSTTPPRSNCSSTPTARSAAPRASSGRRTGRGGRSPVR